MEQNFSPDLSSHETPREESDQILSASTNPEVITSTPLERVMQKVMIGTFLSAVLVSGLRGVNLINIETLNWGAEVFTNAFVVATVVKLASEYKRGQGGILHQLLR